MRALGKEHNRLPFLCAKPFHWITTVKVQMYKQQKWFHCKHKSLLQVAITDESEPCASTTFTNTGHVPARCQNLQLYLRTGCSPSSQPVPSCRSGQRHCLGTIWHICCLYLPVSLWSVLHSLVYLYLSKTWTSCLTDCLEQHVHTIRNTVQLGVMAHKPAHWCKGRKITSVQPAWAN